MSTMHQGMYRNRVKKFFLILFWEQENAGKFTILIFPTLDFLMILQYKNSGNLKNSVVLYPIFINYYPGMHQKVSFLVAIAIFFREIWALFFIPGAECKSYSKLQSEKKCNFKSRSHTNSCCDPDPTAFMTSEKYLHIFSIGIYIFICSFWPYVMLLMS